ncbi:MAG: hypothetical protein ABSH44_17820 [Bryobacteraceae bacterium]|jgi:hypothetical protein
MKHTALLIFALALVGMAQPKPATQLPMSSSSSTTAAIVSLAPILPQDMAFRLVTAQRDTLAAVNRAAPYDLEAQRQNDLLKTVTAEAEKVCGAKEFVLDQTAAKCVVKPTPPEKPSAPSVPQPERIVTPVSPPTPPEKK